MPDGSRLRTCYADKCQGNPASCRHRYVREEVLEKQFTELLGRLKFDDEVLEWVRDALHASHVDERCEHDEAIKRHKPRTNAFRIAFTPCVSTSLTPRRCGLLRQMSNQWREEQNRRQREIDRHRSVEQSYMDEGVQILELARNAQRLFERQEPPQKRRLLNFVLSNWLGFLNTVRNEGQRTVRVCSLSWTGGVSSISPVSTRRRRRCRSRRLGVSRLLGWWASEGTKSFMKDGAAVPDNLKFNNSADHPNGRWRLCRQRIETRKSAPFPFMHSG